METANDSLGSHCLGALRIDLLQLGVGFNGGFAQSMQLAAASRREQHGQTTRRFLRKIPGKIDGLAIELTQPLVVFGGRVPGIGIGQAHQGIGGISGRFRLRIAFPQGSGVVVDGLNRFFITLQSQLEAGFEHVVDGDFEDALLLLVLIGLLDDRGGQIDDLVVAFLAELASLIAIICRRNWLKTELSHFSQRELGSPRLRVVDNFDVVFSHLGVFFQFHPIQLLQRLFDGLGTDRSDRNNISLGIGRGAFALFVIGGCGRCGCLLTSHHRPGDEGQTAPLLNRSHGLSFP